MTLSLRRENGLGDVLCRATTVLRMLCRIKIILLHEEFFCLQDVVDVKAPDN